MLLSYELGRAVKGREIGREFPVRDIEQGSHNVPSTDQASYVPARLVSVSGNDQANLPGSALARARSAQYRILSA